MIRLLVYTAFSILMSCGLLQHAVTHIPPAVKHDTIVLIKYDTVTVQMKSVKDTNTTVWISLLHDSNSHTVLLHPLPGDNYPQIQAAVEYAKSNPGTKIKATAGHFPTSHSIMIVNRIGGSYGQVTIDLEGATYAKNTPDNFITTIDPQFTDAPAIVIQQGKGCTIKNIAIGGKYTLPDRLTMLDIDTLSWEGWSDGVCTDGRTNPYAGIAIDPFSPPKYFGPAGTLYAPYGPLQEYYLPGMDISGSTAINIVGCAIYHFVAGIVITPSMQANGELINVMDCRIDACRSAYCYTQAQSKANRLVDMMCWGQTQTVIDGVHFGFFRSDGSTTPFIDVMNVAGYVNRLFFLTALTFPATVSRIYAEGVLSLGIALNANAGIYFKDCQIDFQTANQPGTPSPDLWFEGQNTVWENCMLRTYNGGYPTARIVFNQPGTTFRDGVLSMPPVGLNKYWGSGTLPHFDNVLYYYNYYPRAPAGGYTETAEPSFNATLTVDRTSFTGYYLGDTAGLRIGDILLTSALNQSDSVRYYIHPQGNDYQVVGFVSGLSKDTISLEEMGVLMHTGDKRQLFVERFTPWWDTSRGQAWW